MGIGLLETIRRIRWPTDLVMAEVQMGYGEVLHQARGEHPDLVVIQPIVAQVKVRESL